jgi:dynein intermediate chain
VKEFVSYSKQVQTTESWTSPRSRGIQDYSDSEDEPDSPNLARGAKTRRLSKRQRQTEEEIRENIKREIEEELKLVRDEATEPGKSLGQMGAPHTNFPARPLTEEELGAITASEDFMEFIDRSTKVMERALDDHYDLLADYALGGANEINDEEEDGTRGKGSRRIKEIVQFYDDRWTKKRIVSAVDFSPKVSCI